MTGFRKQIAFDLDTKALEKYYPTDSWQNAYEIIKRHLVIKNSWLNFCMRDCRETNIGKEHSKNHIFDNNLNFPNNP